MNAYNRDLRTQLGVLQRILRKNVILNDVFLNAWKLGIDDYYIGAGAVTQTVWNFIFEYPLNHGIKDVDFVYFDADESREDERRTVQRVESFYSGIGVRIDVKNEANVHLWYEKRFGRKISPYTSLETAINTWVSTATSIGVRLEKTGAMKVYAPFGLNDLFGKVVRPNKILVTKDRYEEKVGRWLSKWPDLTVIPW